VPSTPTKGDVAAAPPPDYALPAPVLPPKPAAGVRDRLGLTEQEYADAARVLDIDVPTIKAVSEVESAGRGNLPDGRPVILYEAHVFHRLTGGRFAGMVDRRGVLLSVPKWDRTLYGRTGAHQYDRLKDAKKLDEKAAVFSCSWGLFQIMGFNFASLGFREVDTFVEFMEHTDEPHEQLDLFVRFILVNSLDDELRAKDWRSFARQYNGPGYEANGYHTKLAAAYRKHAGV
jgi:hypothetical protein